MKSIKDTETKQEPQEEVRVYFNLHKKVYSVQKKVNGQWKLSHHTEQINLKNVTFKVYEKGRERVIKEQKKYVHAFVIGTITDEERETTRQVTYNPYKYQSFVTKDDETSIYKADYARLTLTPFPCIEI